jgi:hypothetical protein
LLGVESVELNYNFFMNVRPELIQQRSAMMVPMVDLITKGTQNKTIIVEIKHVYLTFLALDEGVIDIKIHSK